MRTFAQHVETGAWNAWRAREEAIRAVRADPDLRASVTAAVRAARTAQSRRVVAARREQDALRAKAREQIQRAVDLARGAVQPHYPYRVTDFEVRSVVYGVPVEQEA